MGNAWISLKGKWGKSALFTFIMVFISVIFYLIFSLDNFMEFPIQITDEHLPDFEGIKQTGSISLYAFLFIVFSILTCIFTVLWSIGYNAVFCHLVETGEFNWKYAFKGFKRIGRNILTNIILGFAWTVAWIVPIVIFAVLVIYMALHPVTIYDNIPTIALIHIAYFIVIFIIGLVLCYKFLPTYIMIFYKLASDQTSSVTEVIGQTYSNMRKHNWHFFCLTFRFTGWLVLAIVTFGVALLWIMPYMSATMALFLNEIEGRNEAEAIVVDLNDTTKNITGN